MGGDAVTWWFKMEDDWLDNPKVARHLTPLGVAMFIAGITYASRNLTDGLLPSRAIPRLLTWDGIAVFDEAKEQSEYVVGTRVNGWYIVNTEMVPSGLWHDADSARVCPSLVCKKGPAPTDDDYVIHDYLGHQRSRQEVEADRFRFREGKVKGGRAAAAKLSREGGKFQSSATSDGGGETAESGLAETGSGTGSQPAGDGQDSQQESQQDNGQTTGLDFRGKTLDTTKPRRPLHEAALPLAELLSAWLEKNDVKRPPTLDSWAQHADKLFRIDKRNPAQAREVLEWSQQDPFWRKQIHGMENFRKHYDRLRMSWEESLHPATTKDKRFDQPMMDQGVDE